MDHMSKGLRIQEVKCELRVGLERQPKAVALNLPEAATL